MSDLYTVFIIDDCEVIHLVHYFTTLKDARTAAAIAFAERFNDNDNFNADDLKWNDDKLDATASACDWECHIGRHTMWTPDDEQRAPAPAPRSTIDA